MDVKERSNDASMRSSLPYRTYCVQAYAIPFGKCRIRFGAFPYMPHIVVRQLASSAQLPAKHIASVQDVLSTGAPFKVLDSVVGLVAVDVVHLRLAIVVRYERLCDKPVDAPCCSTEQDGIRMCSLGRQESFPIACDGGFHPPCK